jgi:hypothetical protein
VLRTDIDYYTTNNKLVIVNIQLDHHVLDNNPLGKSKNIKLICYKGGLYIAHPKETGIYRQDAVFVAEYDWYPHTNMHDFEVVNFHSSDATPIAKGAGIAIVVIEPLNLYITLADCWQSSNQPQNEVG